jgi:hypothetical protein
MATNPSICIIANQEVLQNVLAGKQSIYGSFACHAYGLVVGCSCPSNRADRPVCDSLAWRVRFMERVEELMSDHTFEEFKSIVDQLKPKARRDVLDYSVFLVWTQTRAPSNWLSVLRGGWLWVAWKVEKLVKP